MASNFVPQVDYTSRDYAAIRDDIISLIPSFLPEWTNTDASDFGITLIELFAYMGDMLNYYIDRSANEGFINTATQRNSVLSIASLLGYTPSTGTPSTVTLTFQNSTVSTISVPAKTQVATTTTINGVSTQIIFETDSAVTVPAAVGSVKGSINVSATQGYTITNEYLGDSTGAAYQVFSLAESPLINGSTQVSANNVTYTAVDYLIDSNSNDPVYTVSTDADGVSYISFGDNISGRIPPIGQVYITYRVGGGTQGNLGPNTLKYILTNIVSGLSVNNQAAAAGGADPESTDSIRFNAPYSLTALNRAVSLRDYAAIAIQVSSVAKAVADATSFNNIILYMAPYGDTSLGTPGVDISGNPTTTFTNTSASLLTYLTDKAPATTTVTVLPPSYVPVNIELTLYVKSQYKQSAVSDLVKAALQNLLTFENVFFAESIVLQYIHNAIATIAGIDHVDVTLLTRNDATFNGDLTAGSATVANVSNFTQLKVGQKISVSSGTVTIPTGTTISAIGTTTITLSAVCGGTGTSPSAALKVIGVNNITCAVNEIPKAGTITVNIDPNSGIPS